MNGRRKRADGSRATVRDVALRAGVSTATVSRALNAPGTVSAALRDRVRAATSALAFVPDPSARSLASRHTRLIGVLAPTLHAARWAECVAGVEARLAGAGYSLLLALTGGDARREEAAAAAMAGRAVEAVVAVGGAAGADAAAHLRRRGIPMAILSADDGASADPPEGTIVVRGAWRLAGQALGAYLASLGHVRCAWVAADGAVPRRAVAVRAGLAAALAGAALPPLRDLAVGPGVGFEPLRRHATDGTTGPPATALICADDRVAAVAALHLAAAGIAVPRDISIVGCGDTPEARHAVPPLTTLRLPFAAAGAATAERVLAGLRGPPPPPADVPVKLVIRRSTGPAP